MLKAYDIDGYAMVISLSYLWITCINEIFASFIPTCLKVLKKAKKDYRHRKIVKRSLRDFREYSKHELIDFLYSDILKATGTRFVTDKNQHDMDIKQVRVWESRGVGGRRHEYSKTHDVGEVLLGTSDYCKILLNRNYNRIDVPSKRLISVNQCNLNYCSYGKTRNNYIAVVNRQGSCKAVADPYVLKKYLSF
jgi:hypothetical protein